jgi:hypothetical protein
MDNTEESTIIIDKTTFLEHLNNFLSSLYIYGFTFMVLTFNLVAMSISLHANINKPFSKKLGGAIFAFMFGLIYIFFNYYLYYIMKKKKTVELYTLNKMFPWY